METFYMAAAIIGLAFLLWDCIEVGRNDAANLVNAVFGARVLARRTAVIIAGLAVILGASAAAPVMETARKGIFDPTLMSIKMAMTIYISVYFVDTVLLFGFSGFGMPVSTTACLVFELVGAALFLSFFYPQLGMNADAPEQLVGAKSKQAIVAIADQSPGEMTELDVGTSATLSQAAASADNATSGTTAALGSNDEAAPTGPAPAIGISVVNASNVKTVIMGILMSIVISGVLSFFFMRIFRGAMGDQTEDREKVLLHGPWIVGAMMTFLIWFMVFKGLKNVAWVKDIKNDVFQEYGIPFVLLLGWMMFTFLVHMIITMSKGKVIKYLFHVTAVIGMICMSFAFGQNDLANCASPGLSALWLWRHAQEGTEIATKIPIPFWVLAGCGVLMASGMFTGYAQRVTRAAVNTGSQFDHVALYAPRWCRSLADKVLRLRGKVQSIAPEPSLTDTGKKIHFDALRASTIMAISASTIAFASGNKIPVSTTYVAFAAVIGTGLADRVFVRGDADLKFGRAIWVVVCWFIAPVIAIVSTGLMALIVYNLNVVGLVIGILLNFFIRWLIKSGADKHEQEYHYNLSSGDAAIADGDVPGS